MTDRSRGINTKLTCPWARHTLDPSPPAGWGGITLSDFVHPCLASFSSMFHCPSPLHSPVHNFKLGRISLVEKTNRWLKFHIIESSCCDQEHTVSSIPISRDYSSEQMDYMGMKINGWSQRRCVDYKGDWTLKLSLILKETSKGKGQLPRFLQGSIALLLRERVVLSHGLSSEFSVSFMVISPDLSSLICEMGDKMRPTSSCCEA